MELPGTPVDENQLSALGFSPLELDVSDSAFDYGGAIGASWATKGDVPEGPGLYAFTVEDDDEMHLCYVGMTSHLWWSPRDVCPEAKGRALASDTADRSTPASLASGLTQLWLSSCEWGEESVTG